MPLGAGLKAGLISSIIYMVINVPFMYFDFLARADQIIEEIRANLPQGSAITAEEIYSATLTMLPVFAVLIILIGGAILGALYSVIQHRLGGTVLVKGVTFGLIAWIVLSLIPNLLTGGIAIGYMNVLVALFGALAYGAFLGMLYDRFSA